MSANSPDRSIAARGTMPLRYAIVGWGAIGRTVASMLADASVDLVAVAKRTDSIAPNDLPDGAAYVTDPGELVALKPDLIVEAAGRDSVEQWGLPAVTAGIDFVVSSVSAFADSELFEAMVETAGRAGARLHIQPGALGGVDALAAGGLLELDRVEHRIVKPPKAWRGTPAETLCDLDALTEPFAFFSGTASEAADQFPKNANVAMTSALAGMGPGATRISLVADPAASNNRHEIKASGAFGELSVTVDNKPLEANPKTSAMAALNLVRTVLNQVGPVVL